MNPAELYRRGSASFGLALGQVADDQWAASTPCTDWDVRALVNHVVGENLWLPALLAGLTIEEVGSRFDGDVLGPEPLAAWSAAHDAAEQAVTADGALARTVFLSFGETAAEEYVRQVAADHVIHAWDLATAVGADTRIDPELVDAVSTWFAGQEGGYRGAGAVAERPPLAEDAEPQTRLLAMFGRVG